MGKLYKLISLERKADHTPALRFKTRKALDAHLVEAGIADSWVKTHRPGRYPMYRDMHADPALGPIDTHRIEKHKGVRTKDVG